MEITLNQYKEHIINNYHYEIDNSPSKREERKQRLEKIYSDEELTKIIKDTYDFLKDVLNSESVIYDGYSKIPIEEDTTSYISLNLTGGYHSDTLFKDDKGRIISKYIARQFVGDYFYIDVISEEREFEDDDIVGVDVDYYLYMQNFPKNTNSLRRELNLITNEPTNVIFLDFDGVINTMHDLAYNGGEKVINNKLEKRIAILADICKEYNCKIVIEASAKTAIDEVSGLVDEDALWIIEIFNLFKKYGIDCIGRTSNVRRRITETSEIPMWKDDEIRLYLFRHPEIVHYCVLDDDDTKTMLHWKVSDLDKVKEHLVTPLYYSDNPDEEGLLPKHKEEVKEALKKENEIRKLALKSIKRNSK